MTPVKNDIQALYSDYAFITEPEPEALVQRSGDESYLLMEDIVGRSFESPYSWYLVVFSPLDRPYEKDPDWFTVKGLSKCRDMFKKPQSVILTREILDCKKVHINVLVCTDQDLSRRNNKIYCNKYYVFAQRLNTPADRQRVLAYITKEMDNRTFVKYLDYIIWDRV